MKIARHEGSPHQGPSGAQRDSSVFSRMLQIIDPPRGWRRSSQLMERL